MTSPTCIALFCEDIRRETGNRDTIIGVLPAVTRISKLPGTFRRFSVYFRIRLPLDHDANKRVFINIEADGVSDAEVEDDEGMPKESLERAIARAKERNAPFVEITARLHLNDFPVIGTGQIRAIATVGDEHLVGAFLNVELKEGSSSEHQSPPDQSPPQA